MQTLIITAHPAKRGFTHTIAQTYKKTREDADNTVELIDLYQTDLQQEFLRFEDHTDFPADPVRDQIQTKIKAADELVLVFPIWWGDAPAILKNFFDQNFTSGFAFAFENEKPVGLLKGKTARIFATCDGPSIFYKLFPVRLASLWSFGRVGFCGIKLKSFDVLGSKSKSSESKLQKFLGKVAKRAKSN